MLLPPSRIALAEMQPIKESEESEENYADCTNSDTNSNANDKTSPLLEQVIKSN